MLPVTRAVGLLASLPANQLGIICARYKEPLDAWAPVAANTYLYSKGGIQNDAVPHTSFRSYVDVANTGREGQTYLQHIVKHYDTLEDQLIFTQADPFDLIGPVINTTEQMVQLALQVPAGTVTPFNGELFHAVADWDKIDWTSPKQRLWISPAQIKTLTPAPYTAGQFWELVLGCGQHPAAIRAMHGGVFAVTKETVRRQPKAVYERALAEFDKANAVNPEIGFFMERMWAPLFSDLHILKDPPPPAARRDLQAPAPQTQAGILRHLAKAHF